MVPPIVPTPVPPPGFYIAEEMAARGLTVPEVALALDLSEAAVSELLRGELRIKLWLAEDLAVLFGVSPDFFLNLQRAYDDQ